MKAGRLRHRITVERPVYVQSSNTGSVSKRGWETVKEDIPAEVKYLSGRELIAAQATHSKVTARITIRNRPEAITADMRILFKNKIFNIEAVLPDDKSGNEYLTLPVYEGTNNG